jgi:WD40 repeat protein
MHRLLCCLVLVGLVAPLFGAAPPPRTPPEVKKLIEALGDDDVDTRKAAEKKLIALGANVLPALRRAIRKHPDVDVRLRAAVVAAAIAQDLRGEVRQFTGHPTGWVMRLAILPDGKRALSSGDILRLWDLHTGKLIRGFGRGGWALGLSADGKRVASSSWADLRIHVYEVETGRLLRTFAGHTAHLWGAALSPDGRRLVSGGQDSILRVWDVETGKALPALAGPRDPCRCLAWSPDGKSIACGHYVAAGKEWRGILRLYDVKTGKPRWEGKGHDREITGVAFSRDGRRLATSSFDGTIRVWDAATGKEEARITVNKVGTEGVAFSPDGKRLVSAGITGDDSVRVLDLATRKEVRRFDGHPGGPLGAAFTVDGKFILSCGKDGKLRLWRMPR